MVGIDLGSAYVWGLILALGIGCFTLRLSFIQLHGWLIDFPPRLERALGFLPPAILAALVFSQLFVPADSFVATLVNERVIAGGAAAIVAWRTENMVATIGVGMAVLWVFLFVFG